MRRNGTIQQPEVTAAWRLFCCNWVMLGGMSLTLAAALIFTDFSIVPGSALKPAVIVATYLAYTYYSRRWQKKPDTRVAFILGATGQILLIPVLMTPLIYVAAAINLPLQDTLFNGLDHALGLDWVAYFNFIYHRYALLYAAVIAYGMIGWPIFAVPIALGWTRQYRRLQEFTLAFGIALVVTTVVAALLPGIGTYAFYNVFPDPKIFTPGAYMDFLHAYPQVRDGSLRVLAYSHFTGLITFPSFHAAAAALYVWAFWPVRRLGVTMLVVNLAMMAATPIGGGHYFFDVIAGIAIAAGSVLAARAIGDWVNRLAPDVASQQTLSHTAA